MKKIKSSITSNNTKDIKDKQSTINLNIHDKKY